MAINKPYPKYKNSNIPWLGEIPEHWEVRKLKSISKIVNGATPSTSDEGNWNGDILWITPAEINNITYISDSIRKITKKGYESCGTFIVPKNSIVLTTRAPIGKLVITKAELCTNQGCKSIIPLESDTKFLFYQLSVRTKELNALGTGTTFMELGGFELKNLSIISPKIKEQTAIARFLDYKLAKINRFIQKKKQLIKLLNEQKAAIINQAVTKGLDPNAKVKDSGIEWLGEIPEHWEVRKLKYVAKVKTGKTPKIESSIIDFFENGTIDWFTPGDFGNEGILKISNRKINELAINDSQISLFPKNTVFMVGIGGTIGKIGICFDESSCNQQINALIFNNYIDPFFAFYFLKTQKHQIDLLADFTTLPILNQSKTKDIIFIYPKKDEQHQIVSFIEQETATINTTISKIEKELALTEEYKTALIAEAVTGKIDVRGYEVPEIENEEETYEEIEEEISMAAEDAEEYQTIEE